jgi:hypothetical protein
VGRALGEKPNTYLHPSLESNLLNVLNLKLHQHAIKFKPLSLGLSKAELSQAMPKAKRRMTSKPKYANPKQNPCPFIEKSLCGKVARLNQLQL